MRIRKVKRSGSLDDAPFSNGYKGDRGQNAKELAQTIKDHGAAGDTAFLGLHRGTTSASQPTPDDGDFNQKVRPKPGKAIG